MANPRIWVTFRPVPDPETYQPSIEAARKRLGLDEDGHLDEQLVQWRKLEMRLAWMSAEAPSDEARASYEKDLSELRTVLRVLEERPAPISGGKSSRVIWVLLIALLLGGGFLGFVKWSIVQESSELGDGSLGGLEDDLETALEKRRWDEAEAVIGKFESMGASEQEISLARSRVEEGRVEEQEQQIAFLISNVQSSLDAGQLSEAENYCLQIESLEPNHPRLPGFRTAIDETRLVVQSNLMVSAIQLALEEDDIETAQSQFESLRLANPDHPQIPSFRATLKTEEAKMKVRREKSAKLVAQARELDEGTYSAEAIALMEEAVRLNPSKENRELYRRMSSYGKMLKVPGDHKTITAALKSAKVNDRVFVSKGVYHETLVIPNGVELVGESRGDTIIECPAGVGAVITVPSDSRGVRVASLTLRHSGLVNDLERFPIVAIDGGEMSGEDLNVVRASGHGIAVLDGGSAKLTLSKISDSGWDGVSVTGEESSVSLLEVICEGNLHHGVDFWDGASGVISRSFLTKNGRNGIFAIGSVQPIKIDATRSEKNHELGYYFSSVAAVTITDSEAIENSLGGMLFTKKSKGIKLKGNRVNKNGEAGVIFERGVEVVSESDNLVDRNKGKQTWRDAVFPELSGEDTVSPPPPPPPPPSQKE